VVGPVLVSSTPNAGLDALAIEDLLLLTDADVGRDSARVDGRANDCDGHENAQDV